MSVVEVDEADGIKFPLSDGTRHVANLVRVGNVAVILDGGNRPTNNYRVKVIYNGNLTSVDVVRISSMHGADGLGIDRIYSLLRVRNELDVIQARVAAVPGIRFSKFQHSLSISQTHENSAGMIKPLEIALNATRKLLSRKESAHSPVLVASFERGLFGSLQAVKNICEESLQNIRDYDKKISERPAEKQMFNTAAGDDSLDKGQSAGDPEKDLGGIDLDPAKLRLQETGGKIDLDGTFDAAALDRQIDGFSPVLLSVTPLKDSQAFFGATSQ